MSSVHDVSEALAKIGEYLQNTNATISEKCKDAKEYFKNEDGSNDVNKLEDVVSLLQKLYGHLPQFTSTDPVKVLHGVLGIVSSISSFVGLGGPVVPVVCGLLNKVFSTFGGDTLTVGEVVQDEIRRKFPGLSDETLLEEAQDLHLMYSLAFDFLNPASEKSHFTEHDITNMHIQMNIFQGGTFLRKLGKLIKELAKEHEENDPNKKIEKAKKAMDFIELYIKLASLRDMLLIQFYTITNSTLHSQHLAGGVQRVIGSFAEKDREVLRLFLKPTKEYVYIVSYIREEEHRLLMKFLGMRGLLPEESWLTQGEFELCSVRYPKYHAIRLRSHRLFFGYGDLSYIRGTKDRVGPESLFSFEKVQGPGNYVYITQKGHLDEFVTMTKGSNKWIKTLKEPPGPESEWKAIQMDNGNYMFSPRAFPDHFMAMSKLLDGSVAGRLGCSRNRCQWTLKTSH